MQFCSTSVGPGSSLTIPPDCKTLKAGNADVQNSLRLMPPAFRRRFSAAAPVSQADRKAGGLWGHGGAQLLMWEPGAHTHCALLKAPWIPALCGCSHPASNDTTFSPIFLAINNKMHAILFFFLNQTYWQISADISGSVCRLHCHRPCAQTLPQGTSTLLQGYQLQRAASRHAAGSQHVPAAPNPPLLLFLLQPCSSPPPPLCFPYKVTTSESISRAHSPLLFQSIAICILFCQRNSLSA